MSELYHTTCQQRIDGEDISYVFYCLAENEDDAREQAIEQCVNELGDPVLQMPYIVPLSEFAAIVDRDPLNNFGSWVATWQAVDAMIEYRRDRRCTETLDMFAEVGG